MRRYLALTTVAVGLVGVYLLLSVIQALKHITITNHGVFWMAILGAIALQICGHILRARRTKLIIDQAALSSDRFQFGASIS